LSVIDVAHDRDHWRTALAILLDFGLFDLVRGFLLVADVLAGGAEIQRQFLSQLDVQRLIDRRENLLIEKPLDHQGRLGAELLSQFPYRNAFRDRDFTIDGRRRESLLTPRNGA